MCKERRPFLRLGFPTALVVCLLVLSTIAKAGTQQAGKDEAQAQSNDRAETARISSVERLELEVRKMKELLQAQQKRLDALEAELEAARTPASAKLAAAESERSRPSRQSPETLNQRLERAENRLSRLGPFMFSGDLRLRGEPFFGGPADRSLVRTRGRFRARFAANAKLNDQVSGGLALASGDLNDPIVTNQSFDQFYTRKIFALDRAFISYTPQFFKALTLTGGKFAYTWYTTELTWDKDLNPEGLAQNLTWNLDSLPGLKKVALVGFQLPFTEVAGTSLNNKGIAASAVYGGQLQTGWQFAPWLKLSAFSTFYNFHNADPVALALTTANPKNPTTPLVGLLPQGAGGKAVQNSMVTTTATSVVTVNGVAYPTGVRSISNAQFASKFALLDAIARFDITTREERWPIALIGDYVQNTRACANLSHLRSVPLSTATTLFSQAINAPCNSHERRGYWAEARLGRTREPGDWQFAYTRMFIEREAVLGAFNASDMRQSTNVTQHRVEVFYQAHRNVQLGFTGFLGRPLNFGNAGPPENLLKRLQFDALYTF